MTVTDITLARVLERTGATYRQVDYWIRAGYLKVDSWGSGVWRSWPEPEIEIARLIVKLTAGGLALATAARVARECVEHGEVSVMLTEGVWIEVTR